MDNLGLDLRLDVFHDSLLEGAIRSLINSDQTVSYSYHPPELCPAHPVYWRTQLARP